MSLRLIPHLLLLLGPLSACRAEEPDQGARLELLSEAAVIAAGEPFTVGVAIRHQPGFHTYWSSPGAVGLPTSIDWELPDGFRAGEIRWPVPEHVDMAGHASHGYTRDVMLLVEITPPPEIAATEVTLGARIVWMACADACHPGDRHFSLTLPVGDSPRADPALARRFEAARADLPGALEEWTAELLSGVDSPEIRLRLSPRSEDAPPLVDPYFFSEDGQVSSVPPSVTVSEDGSRLLEFPRAEFGPEGVGGLPGLLAFGPAGQRRVVRIDPAAAGE